MESFFDLLKAFGFREMKEWIVITCSLLFLVNFLGGMIAAIFVVNAKSLKKPKLTSRISFRMFILSEFILVFSAFYYHIFMVEMISGAHVVYWIAAMLMMPLLAIIGAQVMYLIFSGKVKAKRDALRAKAKKIRSERTSTMEVDHSKVAKPKKGKSQRS